MRIGKYISNAGYCSRREAEELIFKKKVKINNTICTHPSEKVSEKDSIKINNKIIELNYKLRLWKMNKPIKYICTNRDQKKRKTVFDLIPKNFPRMISIGRLDFMTEGLLLFTNNGDYARKLELPNSNIERTYKVLIKGKVLKKDINKINKGIEINGFFYKKIKVEIKKNYEDLYWLNIKLKEGKNREIRNICNHFYWQINKLIRTQFGPYKLSNLNLGKIEEIEIK